MNQKTTATKAASDHLPSHSALALNATNFCLAEVVAVVMPFLGKYLLGQGWNEGAIGTAIALAGLGVFVMQSPAGFLTDRLKAKRLILAAACAVLGMSYCLLPAFSDSKVAVSGLLFLGGAAQAFFVPVLGALALSLAGSQGLPKIIGSNQVWNHAGNILAAVCAMLVVRRFGLTSVFYGVGVGSALAIVSAFAIKQTDLEKNAAETSTTTGGEGKKLSFLSLVKCPSVRGLILATALFHLANAPILPLVGLNITKLGGNDTQVAATVLVAQIVMVAVAWLAGRYVDKIGRKKILLVAFLVLPVRIALYSLAQTPWALVALQTLDGVGAGIYGVVIVVICADLAGGKGHFNALQGVIATALGLGGVIGPLGAGFLTETLGFTTTYGIFAGIAALAAAAFWFLVPESESSREQPDKAPKVVAAVAPA